MMLLVCKNYQSSNLQTLPWKTLRKALANIRPGKWLWLKQFISLKVCTSAIQRV